MTVEEIINYISKTPENTNPNILRGQLNDLISNNGDFELFYTTQTYKQNDILTEEDITALTALSDDPMTYCAFMFPTGSNGITYRCPLNTIRISGTTPMSGSNGTSGTMPKVSCSIRMTWATYTVGDIVGYVPTSTNQQTYDNVFLKIYKYKT